MRLHSLLEQFPPSSIEPVYFCRVCGGGFTTAQEAYDCAQSTPRAKFKPGQIVMREDGYGWFDGLDIWNRQDGHVFHGAKTLRFFWVVVRPADPPHRTAFQGAGGYHHRVRWVLRTLGMTSQHYEIQDCETSDWDGERHPILTLARKVPPKVRAMARRMLDDEDFATLRTAAAQPSRKITH